MATDEQKPRILPDWVFEWANGDDEAKRHEATRVIQQYVHALPQMVRDAIKDDLEARAEQAPKKFVLASRSSDGRWFVMNPNEEQIRKDFAHWRDIDKETYLCVVLEEGPSEAFFERQRQAAEERKKRHKHAH